jgi:hypothetical protein
MIHSTKNIMPLCRFNLPACGVYIAIPVDSIQEHKLLSVTEILKARQNIDKKFDVAGLR